MPSYTLYLGGANVDKATSGAYNLLFEGGGYTGNLDLHGPARFDYISASGLGVQNNLNVTGNQVTFGNLTGYNYNHLARIVCTGDAYLKSVTGNLKIEGNVDLNNNLRVTGSTIITGSLYVNGVQITGVGAGTSITGITDSVFTNRGDLIVGTGTSLYSIFNTGGASSGFYLIYDPSQPTIPFRWGKQTGDAYAGLQYTSEINKTSVSSGVFFRPSYLNYNIGLTTLGFGSFVLGDTGNHTAGAFNCFVFGSGNALGSSRRALAQGAENLISGSINGAAFGRGNRVNSNSAFCFGESNCANAVRSISFGERALTSQANEIAQGAGGFGGISGSAQYSSYVFTSTTEDNSPIFIANLQTPTNSTFAFDAIASAVTPTGINKFGGFQVRGCIKNEGGVMTLLNSLISRLGDDDAAWGIDASTDGSNLQIIATGDTAYTTQWVTRIGGTIVTY